MIRERKRVLFSWSSGKDSAWALHLLRQQSDVELAESSFSTQFSLVWAFILL
jgi:tRNA(Ile)-lysidine synthase TilS/MesJ